MSAGTDHADIWAYESAACEPAEWERWIDAVESILGHSADGDSAADGYSLDEFYDTWKQGVSPDAAAAGIRHILTRDGHQYWLRKSPGGELRQPGDPAEPRVVRQAMVVADRRALRHTAPGVRVADGDRRNRH